MNNTVLGEIYLALSELELKQLDLFMTNSHWRYRETVFKCHICFHEAILHHTLSTLEKKKIFTFIYESESYSDGKLRFVFNRLLEAIREHILLTQNKVDNIFAEKIWIDFLLEKKLRKNIQYNLEKEERASSSEYKYLLKYFKSQELNVQSFQASKDVNSQFESIKALMTNAELFADLVYIRNCCALLSFSNVYQTLPIDLSKARLEDIRTKYRETNLPEFLVYLSLLDLLLSKSQVEYYFHFKSTLFQHLDIWNEDEKDNFLSYLLNFTTQKINQGNAEFLDEQYDLIQFFIDKEVYYTPTRITQGRINNAVFIFLRKNEFMKAETFVLGYVDFLSNDLKDSCRHFNLARIFFENKKYKAGLRELLKVDFQHDAGYGMNSKILLLKTYYELQETEAFYSLCSSFKEYVRKNKVLSDVNKEFLSTFIKFIKRLYLSDSKKAKRIHIEIEKTPRVAEKKWLLEKVTLLYKK